MIHNAMFILLHNLSHFAKHRRPIRGLLKEPSDPGLPFLLLLCAFKPIACSDIKWPPWKCRLHPDDQDENFNVWPFLLKTYKSTSKEALFTFLSAKVGTKGVDLSCFSPILFEKIRFSSILIVFKISKK